MWNKILRTVLCFSLMLEPVAEIWQLFSKSKSGKLGQISKTSFGYVQKHIFQVKKCKKIPPKHKLTLI
jgi:hypothetical protein